MGKKKKDPQELETEYRDCREAVTPSPRQASQESWLRMREGPIEGLVPVKSWEVGLEVRSKIWPELCAQQWCGRGGLALRKWSGEKNADRLPESWRGAGSFKNLRG